jgi:hypothetical protein
MNFGRMASIVLATAAVVGVFVEIPIISNYAFWIFVGAYLVWIGAHPLSKNLFKLGLMISIVRLLAAIVGVFVEIPIVSNYAFWVMASNYLIIVCRHRP